jgi:hypothetical protein
MSSDGFIPIGLGVRGGRGGVLFEEDRKHHPTRNGSKPPRKPLLSKTRAAQGGLKLKRGIFSNRGAAPGPRGKLSLNPRTAGAELRVAGTFLTEKKVPATGRPPVVAPVVAPVVGRLPAIGRLVSSSADRSAAKG